MVTRFRLNPSLTSPTSALFVLYVQPDGYTVDSLAGEKKGLQSRKSNRRGRHFHNGHLLDGILFIREIPEWLHGFENLHQTLNPWVGVFSGNYSLNECEEPTTSFYQHCSVQNHHIITNAAIPGWLELARLLLAPPAGWNTRLDCNSIPAAFFLSFPSQLCVIESGNVTGLIAWTSECSAGAGMNTMHCEPLVQATLWFFFFFSLSLNALHSPLFRAAAATFQDFGRVGSPVNLVFGWR